MQLITSASRKVCVQTWNWCSQHTYWMPVCTHKVRHCSSMSLQLPWAVAFIAQGIRGDVNKVVDCGEMTLLAKTKGKKANMGKGQKEERSQRWQSSDQQPHRTDATCEKILKLHSRFFLILTCEVLLLFAPLIHCLYFKRYNSYHKKQARTFGQDIRQDKTRGRDEEVCSWGWIECTSESRESDDRSGLPIGLVSVNNLHISTDSFK